jgi:hypothetical protein
LGNVVFETKDAVLGMDWGWIPVVDFAVAMAMIAKSLKIGENNREVFEFTESDATITFRRELGKRTSPPRFL